MAQVTKSKLYEQTWFIILIPYLILVCIHVLLGLPMKLPTIYPDEHAYLAYAKFFGGLGVTEVFRGELLGSYGYSILIAPAFIFFKNPINSYQAVIVINSLLASTLYIVAFFFLRQVINLEKRYSILLSFLLCLYPAYLLQSNSAYTESLTPTLFLLSILTFWHFLNKPNFLTATIYSLVLGFFYSVHIRIIPTMILSIFFISFLTYKKVINIKIGIYTIAFQILLLFIVYTTGHSITILFSPEYNATYKILERLLMQLDMVLLVSIIFFTWFFAIRRKYIHLVLLYVSSISGILYEIKLLSILFIILILLSIILLFIFKKISIKELIFLTLSSLFLYALSLLVIPETRFISYSLELIYFWFIRAVGTLYYLSVASYGLFLIGVLFVIYFILINKQEYGEYFKSNLTITLLFAVLVSFSLLFVTITPKMQLANEGRADHIFYGRYSEVFLPIFFLLGLLSFVKPEKLNREVLFIFSSAVFLVFFLLLFFNYGNIISSELSFQSVLSFFPYRAVLGNINLVIFTIATAIILAILSFLLIKKKILGFIFLFFILISFSLFTYYYTFYYYQQDVQNRTSLLPKILLLQPYYKEIWVDKKYSQNSNLYNYAYILPNIRYIYEDPKAFGDSCSVVLSGPNFNQYHSQAIPIGIENDGNDLIWALPGPYYETLKNKYMPSFLNMNLIDSNLVGLKRTGFYKNTWINGKARIRFPLKQTDSLIGIAIKIKSNDTSVHNFIIHLNNKEILNQDIGQGIWQFDFKVQIKKASSFHEIRFYSDLTKVEREYLVGIELLELRLIGEEETVQKDFISSEQTKLFNFLENTPYFIHLRDNYRIHSTFLQKQEKILVPIDLINLDYDRTVIKQEDTLFISYRWRDFVFRKIKKVGGTTQLIKDIEAGEKRSYMLELEAPENAGKYFLEFDLMNNKNNWLDINSKFTPRYIIVVK